MGHSARRVSGHNPRYGIADFEPHSNEVNLQNDTKSHPSVLLLILIALNCPKNTQFSGNYVWVTQLAGLVTKLSNGQHKGTFVLGGRLLYSPNTKVLEREYKSLLKFRITFKNPQL